MIQYRTNLFHGDTRKPFDELINTAPIFQVFKKSTNRHTRAAKHPCTTYSFGVMFNGRTTRPIQHEIILAREEQGVKPGLTL
jgi:hypothetical protein